MEESNPSPSAASVPEVKSETPVNVGVPQESAPPAKKKSHKVLYIFLIIIGIILVLILLAGFAVKKAYNSLDPELKEGVGKVYECSLKCQELPKDERQACAEKCVAESGLDDYVSPMPSDLSATNSGEVSSTGAYTNSEKGFSFTPPPGWTQTTQPGVIIAFSNPKSPQTSVNVVSESAPGFSLAEYVEAAKEQLVKAIPGYKVSSEKNVTVDGLTAYQMDGAFTQSGVSLVNRQLIVVNDGKVYVLTATSTPDAWASNQAVIDTSLKSLKLN